MISRIERRKELQCMKERNPERRLEGEVREIKFIHYRKEIKCKKY